MIFRTIPPPPHLARYVRFYWVLELRAELPAPYIYRSMADACTELLFHYEGPFLELGENGETLSGPLSLVHGQSSRFRRYRTEGNFGIFGAYLYPFAVPKLFRTSSHSLSNEMPGLDALLGRDGSDLEERIMLAADNDERAGILSRFLEGKLLENEEEQPQMEGAIRFALDTDGKTTVQQLADRFNLSRRQFERKFKDFSGFSPKRYLRIVRFQNACDAYPLREKTLTEIAYECGYYDQSHFIHEFRAFSGYHPRAFFSGNAEGIEYRDVAAE